MPRAERIAVAPSGGPEAETLIRAAARSAGAELLAVHVVRNEDLADADDANPANLARQRLLVERLGGTYHQIIGDDIPAALLRFARGAGVTQLVVSQRQFLRARDGLPLSALIYLHEIDVYHFLGSARNL